MMADYGPTQRAYEVTGYLLLRYTFHKQTRGSLVQLPEKSEARRPHHSAQLISSLQGLKVCTSPPVFNEARLSKPAHLPAKQLTNGA